eukprot:GHVU01221335.1.p1 GENE.GHVU01221335.1~~GHVU01221335.1.p1  ORF type:complete len:251 (-),score=21.17 GHVU01221335.1:349-1101(-)
MRPNRRSQPLNHATVEPTKKPAGAPTPVWTYQHSRQASDDWAPVKPLTTGPSKQPESHHALPPGDRNGPPPSSSATKQHAEIRSYARSQPIQYVCRCSSSMHWSSRSTASSLVAKASHSNKGTNKQRPKKATGDWGFPDGTGGRHNSSAPNRDEQQRATPPASWRRRRGCLRVRRPRPTCRSSLRRSHVALHREAEEEGGAYRYTRADTAAIQRPPLSSTEPSFRPSLFKSFNPFTQQSSRGGGRACAFI